MEMDPHDREGELGDESPTSHNDEDMSDGEAPSGAEQDDPDSCDEIRRHGILADHNDVLTKLKMQVRDINVRDDFENQRNQLTFPMNNRPQEGIQFSVPFSFPHPAAAFLHPMAPQPQAPSSGSSHSSEGSASSQHTWSFEEQFKQVRQRLVLGFGLSISCGATIMEDLLKDWGFDSYVGVFQDNEIDLDALKDMTADMVKEIITKIGPRAKFLSKLKLYQSIQKADVLFTSNLTAEDENQSSNASEGSLDDLQPLYIYSQKAMIGQPYKFAPVGSYSDSIVKKLLDEAPEGPAIISSYGPTKQFMRNTLCNLIIKNELKEDKGKSIPKERFIKLANEIYDLFPHEYPETYYVPYVNKTGTPKAARGKLWNAYIHMRRRFRNFGMIASTSNVNASEGLEDEIDEDKTEKVLWLKNNSTPFTMVSEFWEETYTYRKKLLATIDSYISSFPVLKEPLGYTLFEKDFEKLFKNKTNLLFNRWPQIARALIKHVFLKKVSVVLAAIEEYESANNLKLNAEELSDADQLFILINCLPMIFTSAPIKAKSQRWRPSKLEVKQGFVLQAKDAADMQLKLVQRKQKYELYGLPMQPIPILVGDIQSIEACYVNINKVFYKIDTPLKAIDVTFKIIHVLDAEYSAESKIVWLFIQQAVYQIHTDHDQNFTTVSSLVSDLKNYLPD